MMLLSNNDCACLIFYLDFEEKSNEDKKHIITLISIVIYGCFGVNELVSIWNHSR